MSKRDHPTLFDELPFDWESEWWGMPEYKQKDLTGLHKVVVHFKTQEDIDAFAKLVDQKVTINTRSLWFPKAEIIRYGRAE